ncbi:Synapse-associated protein 1 [Strongyloides ratti]|uniref:Synapse-associated protein 1 n=1 Tax=Strongyloides ratti TaxID=34506 RepID=A0A090MZC5_STRRB|nr:Synapse-associated protein 1 [Strongyloides ratti]CEF68694.1 Synapse-associated protein 1 [Strongyloides ratti]
MSWWSNATLYGKTLTEFVKKNINGDNETEKVIKGEEFDIENVEEVKNERKNSIKSKFVSLKDVAVGKANEWKEYMNEIATTKEEDENNEEGKANSTINNRLTAITKKATDDFSKFARKASDITVKKAGELKNLVDKVAKDSLLGELDRENLKYIEELEKEKSEETIDLPWIGMPDEGLAQKRILSLSLDAKNFTGHVPESIGYTNREIDALAGVMIEKDPHLRKMRMSLVPKEINEEKFWKNYAYKVYIVRKILMEETNSSNKTQNSVDETTDDDWEKEILGDLDYDTVMEETGNKSNEQWEAEINEILESNP